MIWAHPKQFLGILSFDSVSKNLFFLFQTTFIINILWYKQCLGILSLVLNVFRFVNIIPTFLGNVSDV